MFQLMFWEIGFIFKFFSLSEALVPLQLLKMTEERGLITLDYTFSLETLEVQTVVFHLLRADKGYLTCLQ